MRKVNKTSQTPAVAADGTGNAVWPPAMNLTFQISQDTALQANFQSMDAVEAASDGIT